MNLHTGPQQARMERMRVRLRKEVKLLEEKLQNDRVLVDKKILGGKKRIQRLKHKV